MLREIRNVRQIPGELHRRWFSSNSMDLIVWVDTGNSPVQFQLYYNKGTHRTERAFTWKPDAGYTHTAVDDGEFSSRHYKASPILVTESSGDAERINNAFLAHSANLPVDIIEFISTKIQAYKATLPHSVNQNSTHNNISVNSPS